MKALFGRLVSVRSHTLAALILSGAVFLFGETTGSARAQDKQQPSPEELELDGAFRGMAPVARTCRGSVACFSALTRPFGPLALTVGESAGSANPAYARQVTNFALGVAGGIAKVNSAKLANDFHCGPPCGQQREKELIGSLALLQQIAEDFAAAGFQVVALWPDGAFRVDDSIVRDNQVSRLGRTRLLGIAEAWQVAGTPTTLTESQARAAKLVPLLRQTVATTIASEPFGGVRVIHKDSIGDNEAGLLFIDDERAKLIDARPLPDGSRYQSLQKVTSGVFFYTKT